jgi:hypothetical protein
MRRAALCLVALAACGGKQPPTDDPAPQPESLTADPGGPDAGPDSPGELPMSVVEEHMGPVREKVQTCADATTFEGKVAVRVVIQPDGSAKAELQAPSGDDTIDGCITGAFDDVTFPTSERGQQFRYSFTF